MVAVSYGHGNLYDFEDGFLFKGSITYTSTNSVADKTTTYCSTFNGVGDDLYNGCYLKCLSATNSDNIGETVEVTDFEDDAPHAFFTHDAFTANTATGDTFLLSAFKIVEDGQTLATPLTLEQEYLKIQATGSAGNESGYMTNFTNLGLSTTIYTKILLRYQTTDSMKAKVIVTDDAAYSQTVLADSASVGDLTVVSVDLTTGETLDHIRFYADHDTGYVYYDFALVYKGDFTFPNCAFGLNGVIPNRNTYLEIPGRLTNASQQLGSGNFKTNIACDFTKGDWTRTGDVVDGQVFYDICHNAVDEPWQWLDTEREQMKVTLDPPKFRRAASADRLTDRMDLVFNEKRLGSADNTLETYITRWGLDV